MNHNSGGRKKFVYIFEEGEGGDLIGMRGKRGFHSALIGRNKEEEGELLTSVT